MGEPQVGATHDDARRLGPEDAAVARGQPRHRGEDSGRLRRVRDRRAWAVLLRRGRVLARPGPMVAGRGQEAALARHARREAAGWAVSLLIQVVCDDCKRTGPLAATTPVVVRKAARRQGWTGGHAWPGPARQVRREDYCAECSSLR